MSDDLIDYLINIITSEQMSDNEQPFYFQHIYNGIIFANGKYYPMIEFKIKTTENANTTYLFCNVDYKCAWFVIDSDNRTLLGPVGINKEKIINGERFIDDEQYEEINGCEIEAVSNEAESIIDPDDLPDWMMMSLNNATKTN